MPALCVLLCVRCPGPLGSCSAVCILSALCCVCNVLVHLPPVHRCARPRCCVVCAMSWATWLLFRVCPLGALCCLCGVLRHIVSVHCRARSCNFSGLYSFTGLIFIYSSYSARSDSEVRPDSFSNLCFRIDFNRVHYYRIDYIMTIRVQQSAVLPEHSCELLSCHVLDLAPFDHVYELRFHGPNSVRDVW